MATVVNFIDTTLQAAAARGVNLPTADIQLLPDSPGFHVAVDGSITPASITFTATLVDLEAPALNFNSVGGDMANVAAKSVSIAGASMPGTSATVIASVTVNGKLYTKACTVWKVQDGAPGTSTPGARGAGHYYAAGSAWTDALANVSVPLPKVVGDVVTISSGTFVMEKRWTGTAWVDNGVVIDGKVIVPQSITAGLIDTRGLSIRDAAGNIILAAGSALAPGYAAPGTQNSEIAVGGNLCYNADFSNGLDGWITIYTNAGEVYSYVNADHNAMAGLAWAVNAGVGLGSTTLQAQQPNATTGGTSIEFQSAAIPVEAGKKYCVSAYTGAHRCNVDVFAFIFDASGATIGVWGNDVDYNAAALQGGRLLAGYKRHQQVSAAMPSNASSVRVVLRKFKTLAGNNDSWMMVARVQLEQVAVDATAAGPWGPPSPSAAVYASVASSIAAINNISSDNVLSKGEKSDLILRWAAITGEASGIANQADALGVNRDAFWLAYYTLNNYLPVGWNDTTTDTPIDGPTFRANFADYYSKREALKNAMTAKSANASADLTLIGRGCSVAGTSGTKTASTSDWDSDVYSTQSFGGGAFASAKVTAYAYIFFGLNNDPATNTTYLDITFSFQTTPDGVLLCRINSDIVWQSTYTPGAELLITYDEVRVSWWRNGQVVTSVAINLGDIPLGFDSSFYTPGATLEKIRCGPFQSALWSKTGGPNKPQDNATAGAPAGSMVGGTEAGLVASRAAYGEAAYNAVNDPTLGLANRLRSNAQNVLAGGAALTVGSLVTDGNGQRVSGYGLGFTSYGFVAYNAAGAPTITVNGITGAIAVAGDLSGSTGTFAAVRVGVSMALQAGAFNSDPGVWFGFVSGVPKFSIVAANGAKLLFDPTLANPLQLVNVATASDYTYSVTSSDGQQYPIFYLPKRNEQFAGTYIASSNAPNITSRNWRVSTSGIPSARLVVSSDGTQATLYVNGNNSTNEDGVDFYVYCDFVVGGSPHTGGQLVTCLFS